MKPEHSGRNIRNGPRFKMRWKLFRLVLFFELVWNVSVIPGETEWNWQPCLQLVKDVIHVTTRVYRLLGDLKQHMLFYLSCLGYNIPDHPSFDFTTSPHKSESTHTCSLFSVCFLFKLNYFFKIKIN
jgi:hypothetical protein